MSFEEIWQEHKSFILTLLAGVIIFFTARMIIVGSFEDEIGRNNRAASRASSQAKRNKVQPGATAEAKRKHEALEASLAKLEREMGYKPATGFTLKAAARAGDLHFNDMVQKLLTGVVEPASSLDIRLDTGLGLGGRTPRSDVEREWYLNGLDLVNRIYLAGIASAVESIEPIKIKILPKKRRNRGEAARYLRPLAVSFTAHGSPAALDLLLRELMKPGARLSVEKASLLSLDSDKKTVIRFGGDDIVRMDIEVKALIVDPDGVPAVSKSGARS
ncbi:MAG: hypothetical protein V3W41_10255 [Planctomycetota bacterium]